MYIQSCLDHNLSFNLKFKFYIYNMHLGPLVYILTIYKRLIYTIYKPRLNILRCPIKFSKACWMLFYIHNRIIIC